MAARASTRRAGPQSTVIRLSATADGQASRNKSFPCATDETPRRSEALDRGRHLARYVHAAWPTSTCRAHRRRACSTLEDPAVIRRILTHLGLSTEGGA